MSAIDIDTPTSTRRRLDWSWPVLGLCIAVLCVLVLLPLFHLISFSATDSQGRPTLANFVKLFTDASFVDPLITTLIIATSVGLICCLVAAPLAWLVARTDMPLRNAVRTLVFASLVTPPFLGAIAWELLAAPNSGLLNQAWRGLTGMPPDEALLDIYTLTGLIFVIACYSFPYVFVLVANALDRMPGELEDASSMLGAKTWTTARRITIPLALPTLVAGILIAFLQALNLFGSPAILAIPGVVLGVGLFLSYTRPPFVLYGTLWILLIAYVTIELPSAYQQLQSALHAVHPELEEAGRILGATRLRTLADITAPLLKSGMVATWCFIFVAVIRELSAAVILFTSQTKVLSVLIFDLKESGDLGAIAVLGLAMIVFTTLVIATANRLMGVSGKAPVSE